MTVCEERLCPSRVGHCTLLLENSLRHSLSNGSLKEKEWWTKLKCACGEGRNTDIPLLVDSEGCERATSYEKSEAFARFFSNKCSVQGRDLTTMDLQDMVFPGAPALTTVHFSLKLAHDCPESEAEDSPSDILLSESEVGNGCEVMSSPDEEETEDGIAEPPYARCSCENANHFSALLSHSILV